MEYLVFFGFVIFAFFVLSQEKKNSRSRARLKVILLTITFLFLINHIFEPFNSYIWEGDIRYQLSQENPREYNPNSFINRESNGHSSFQECLSWAEEELKRADSRNQVKGEFRWS